MNIPELQNFIAEFRCWLKQEGVRCISPDQSTLLTNWHEELTAAESLLEHKPELPIAFLGPSQQGKSSLINALLGENILAVGGAVGACTCVITSVHYQPQKDFRAEIDFISLQDWKAELVAIQEAIDSMPSDEDSPLDRAEWEAEQQAAHEKFKAVYRRELSRDLSDLLDDPNLGLPDDIIRAMENDRAIIVVEDNPLTLRNRVRRYLVGRNQSDDGQFWPLISRVRIYGKFEVLANGVVLVDLPGLNDPNPAREQVTKKYLAQSRYIWLVCNSQTGIDRVFAEVLRENALLFRLFMEGRLDAFSVITTYIDNINLGVVLNQMGIEEENFDGDYSAPMAFRRKEIINYVQEHLLAIAQDIVNKAEATQHREDFFQRVRSIPVFSVSTSAYLHATERMPLYQGMKLSAEASHIPELIKHLHSITLEQSYQTQVEASYRRLQMLHEQVHRFFLNQISRIEQDNTQSRSEWDSLAKVAAQGICDGRESLKHLRVRSEASLQQRVQEFEQRLADLDVRAAKALQSVFASWESINWRSLQAAVKRGGEWFSRSLQRQYDFNRDVARAYLDLLPFVWEDFFGNHLATLTDETAKETHAELHKTAARLIGSLEMLRHQPVGIRDSLETIVRTASETFTLQAGQVRADLTAQIQRTRQSLSTGMVETAADFMQPAYQRAANDPGGTGIKRRMLDALAHYAQRHAPSLFINMRKELAEGVTLLQSSMKPQLSKIVGQGEAVLERFQQNFSSIQVVPPEMKHQIEEALNHFPKLVNFLNKGRTN